MAIGNTREAGIKAVVENLQGYLRDIDKMISADGELNKSTGNLEKGSASFGKTVAGTALGLAAAEVAMRGLKAGFDIGIGGAKDFDRSFRNVQTLFPGMEASVSHLKGETLDLSKAMGIDVVGATDALYQALSAGVPPENAMTFLKDASKAAIAGSIDTMQAVDLLTNVINSYHLSANDANYVSDLLFKTVALGKTTFGELARSMFNVAPTAAAAGVKLEEVTAALASITKQGVPTSVATTQLRQALVELQKPGKELSANLAEIGYESGTAALGALGLQGTLEALSQNAAASGKTLTQVFSSVEAGGAALALTGANAATAASDLKAMGEAAGTTESAFNTMNEAAGRKSEIAMNKLKIQVMELGDKALPAMGAALEAVAKGLEAFDGLSDDTKAIIGMGVAATALVVLFPKLIGVLGGVKTAFMGSASAADAQTAAANRAKLATLGWIAAAAGIAIAADQILKKTTGEGLMSHIMGKADENIRNRKALEDIQVILNAFGEQAERVDRLTSSLQSNADSYKALTAASDEAGKSFQSIQDKYKANDDVKQAEANVRQLAKALQEQGLSTQKLKEIYDTLPPAYQAIFDAETNVVAAYALRADADEKLRFANLQQEMQQRNTTQAVKESVPVVEEAKFAFEAWADSLTDKEGNLLSLKDKMKEVKTALDELVGAFASANPEVNKLKASNAFLNETIQDLERNSDSLTAAQKEYLKSLKDQVTANDDAIAGYTENEAALKGARAALEDYIGPTGLGNLLTVMGNLKVPQEDQIGVLSDMHQAYLTLSNNGIPAALGAFGELKAKLDPAIWAPIAEKLGPEFVQKIVDGYTGQERIDLLAAAEALGLATPEAVAKGIGENQAVADTAAKLLVSGATGAAMEEAARADRVGVAMADGVVSGLNSAASRITGAARGLARGAVDAMATEIDARSPSKDAEKEVGLPMAQGIAVGLTKGFDNDVLPIAKSAMEELADVIKDKGELSLERIRDIFGQAAYIIQEAPLSDAARASALKTMAKFAEGLEEGKGVPARSLQSFLEGLVEKTDAGFEKLRYTTGPKLDDWLKSVTKKISDEKPETDAQLQGMINSLESIMSSAPMGDWSRAMVDKMIQGLRDGIESGAGLALSDIDAFFASLLGAATAGAAAVDGAMSGSWMLGDDGKWYRDEKSMPNGVGGASTAPQGTQAGLAALKGFQNSSYVAPDGKTTNYTDIQGIMSALAQGWITGYDLSPEEKSGVAAQYGNLGIKPPFQGFEKGTSFVPYDMLAFIHKGEAVVPASQNPYAMAAMGPSGGSEGGFSTMEVTIDMRNSTFGGSSGDTEMMVRRVVRDAMREATGREAFIGGVKA